MAAEAGRTADRRTKRQRGRGSECKVIQISPFLKRSRLRVVNRCVEERIALHGFGIDFNFEWEV
jgi:hypothetical protein